MAASRRWTGCRSTCGRASSIACSAPAPPARPRPCARSPGLEQLEAGRVEFAGRDITDGPGAGSGDRHDLPDLRPLSAPDRAREPGLSVARGEGRRRRRSSAASARSPSSCGSPTRSTARPTTASGGEQQRIAIGRALVRRPKLLLLDEPLTNLDAKLRHDMRAEFKRLHRDLGTTMLYATPDQLEALTMGQRIAVMREGRIVEVGTPHELYARPRDAYAAEDGRRARHQSDARPGPAARWRAHARSCRSARSTCRARVRSWTGGARGPGRRPAARHRPGARRARVRSSRARCG